METVRLVRTCSSDELREYVNTYITLANRTVSAYEAWPDVLESEAAARRISVRLGRESKQAGTIIRSCGEIFALGDGDFDLSYDVEKSLAIAAAGEDLVAAVRALNTANGRFWTFVARYIRTQEGSEARYDELASTADDAIDRFNAAWAAYGDEVGFSIDDTPDPPIDESQEAD